MIKVLIIEDSEVVRGRLNSVLAGAGYEVVEAFDGEHALEVFAQNQDVSLIVCDYNIPKTDGLSTLQNIFSKSPDGVVPSIMLTAETSPSAKQRGRSLGVLGWVLKPFKKKMILDVVDQVLANTGEAS